jgi:hypothetical protein
MLGRFTNMVDKETNSEYLEMKKKVDQLETEQKEPPRQGESLLNWIQKVPPHPTALSVTNGSDNLSSRMSGTHINDQALRQPSHDEDELTEYDDDTRMEDGQNRSRSRDEERNDANKRQRLEDQVSRSFWTRVTRQWQLTTQEKLSDHAPYPALLLTWLATRLAYLATVLFVHPSVLLLCTLVFLAPTARAQTPSFFTVLNINSNRTSDSLPDKITAIFDLVTDLMPTVLVVTELLMPEGVPRLIRSLMGNKYALYASPPNTSNSGTLVAVSTKIPSRVWSPQSGVFIHPFNLRRLVPVILELPSSHPGPKGLNTEDFLFMGVYGPQASKDKDVQICWNNVSEILRGCDRWMVVGDMNYALSIDDISPGHALARWLPADTANRINAYRRMLVDTRGADMHANQEIDIDEDYTRQGSTTERSAERTRSVIDRAAIGPAVPAGTIYVVQKHLHPTFDHRPVVAQLPIPITTQDSWTSTPKQPRLTRPNSSSKDQYDEFRKLIERDLISKQVGDKQIETNEEYLRVYSHLHDVFMTACDKSFERPVTRVHSHFTKIPIEEMHLIHLIRLHKNAETAASDKVRWKRFYHTHVHRRDRTLLAVGANFTDGATMQRQARQEILRLERQLTSIRNSRLRRQAKQYHAYLNDLAIRTGSAKKTMPNTTVHIPDFVRTHDGMLISEKGPMLETWHRHWEQSYKRPAPPDVSKPWMHTASAERFRSRAPEDRFQWPQEMTLKDLRVLLTSGNKTPSPGPDSWEKWALAESGDTFLAVVARLANYSITNRYFPPVLKRNTLVSIYKRGDAMVPGNYRGIVLANLLQVICASFARHRLSDYVNKHGMIPQTQAACRTHSRISDQCHILHSIDAHLHMNNEFCYALKGDQKQGFDFLHRDGFEDAVDFFGLPHELLLFEDERARAVTLTPLVRGSACETITTDGLTKQGDPMSPLKYVLTLAMAQWWIDDSLAHTGVVVRDRRRGVHTIHTRKTVRIRMLAATDDTLLLGWSKDELMLLVTALQIFQAAYNMETEWDKPNKSSLMILGVDTARWVSDADKTIEMGLPNGRRIKLKAIARADRRWLNTPINFPKTQYELLDAIVNGFIFPKPGRTLSITAIRRITLVSLASKIRARLEMHPIEEKHATDLNTALARKIKDYYGFTYPMTHDVLFAPVEQGGNGFPDFHKYNAVTVLESMHRILNTSEDTGHHSQSGLMDIIYADLQCQGAGQAGFSCWFPLAPDSEERRARELNSRKRLRSHHMNWEIAQQVCERLGIYIFPTNTASQKDHIRVTAHPMKQLKDVFYHPSSDDPPSSEAKQLLKESPLDKRAVKELRELANRKGFYEWLWATDGSQFPTPPGDDTKTGLAVVGPIELSLRPMDLQAIITDAEIIALALAVRMDRLARRVLLKHHKDNGWDRSLIHFNSTIWSDNLNTVTFCRDVIADPRTHIPARATARAALRFLREELGCHPGQLQIKWLKAHTDATSEEAKANRRADKLAKAAVKDKATRWALPMRFCDRYAIMLNEGGPLHGNVPKLIDRTYDIADNKLVFRKYKPRSATSGEEQQTLARPPKVSDDNNCDYHDVRLFTWVRQGYTAQTQLQVRSHQLPTPARNIERATTDRVLDQLVRAGYTTCNWCTTPWAEVDEHHIFVACKGAEPQAKRREIDRENRDILTKRGLKAGEITSLTGLLDCLLQDDPKWDGGLCMYSKGLLPKDHRYKGDLKDEYCKIAGRGASLAATIWWAHMKAMAARVGGNDGVNNDDDSDAGDDHYTDVTLEQP